MCERKQKFALFGNIYQARKSASIEKVLSMLSLFNADVSIDQEYYRFLHDVEHLDVSAANIFSGNDFEADFAVSMGGDGTFLKTASRVGSKQIPIVGVNMGRLGFLADVSPTDIESCLKALYTGSYSLEERAVIQVEAGGKPLSDGGCALNDVAILKRDSASMISIRVHVDDTYLTTYQADGLIVSTPTGSTAYSLSNGGPIIVPGTKVLSVTAVAPHSLNVRPIVIPDASVVTLDVESRSHSFLVAVDGRSVKCQEGTRITLRRAPYNVRVVKRSAVPYFTTLREKLMWGADSRV
jgi:NAD+ kinase